MARVVVIFAILALITGAMFWLARQPSTHSDVVATLPVQPNDQANTANTIPPASAAATAHETGPAGADALPPAEAASAAASVPPLPTTGPGADLMQQSTTSSPSDAKTGLVVEDVQASSGATSIALRGRADPGATVKVSVNGKPAGEVVVAGSGSWSLAVDKGKDDSEPKIVLELVSADGKLLDKTNFVFKSLAAPPLSPQDHTLVTAQTAEQTKPEAVHKPTGHRRTTFRVRRGESLWRIARRKLGSGRKWRQLYEANKDRIGGDPDFITPGTRLILPG